MGSMDKTVTAQEDMPQDSFGIHRLFEAQARQRPHHTAIEFADNFVSYAELDRRANRMAWALKRRGVKPGDLVGLYLPKGTGLFEAMLGILKAGAGYVPVDLRFPAERINGIFADAGVRAIVTDSERTKTLAPSTAARLRIDGDAAEIRTQPATPVADEPCTAESASPCYAIYTSGSTGRPKGVLVTHTNVRTFATALPREYGLGPDERVYQGFSTAFDASVEEIWAAFALGGTLCIPTEEIARSPADAAAFIAAGRITYFSTVPTFLSMVPGDLPLVRTLVLGGEACPQHLVARWARPGRRMLNTYGPTETTVVATWVECSPDQPVTIGKPLRGYHAYVVDEDMNPVPAGQEGELLIGGNAVAAGYINRPDLTADKFIRNPFPATAPLAPVLYRTHDCVTQDADGNIQFVGRMDDQVKIRGFRVELQEIESVLRDDPVVMGAAVRIVHVHGLPEIAAYIVPAQGATIDRDATARRLKARLPDYMVPRFLETIDALPFTTSGKIDRKSLPEPMQQLQPRSKPLELPATRMEETILDVWRKFFPNTPVSVLDDFFLDLGGHSLLAAQVATALRQDAGLEAASVMQLYTFRTIRALASCLDEWRTPESRTLDDHVEAGQKTRAEQVFATVPVWERWTTVGLQALALLAYHGIQITPLVAIASLALGAIGGTIPTPDALWYATVIGFLAWPSMLLISIAVKWLVVGKLKPGKYPLWGLYYCRWWTANLFQQLGWPHMFSGTPLMSAYYRAMGARIGRECQIMTPIASGHDLLSIGDRASVGIETHLATGRVEDGWLKLGRIDIGRDCFIGAQVAIGIDTRIEENAWIDDQSHVPDGTVIASGTRAQGAPLVRSEFPTPQAVPGAKAKPILYAIAHLGLIYVMGYLLMLAALPGLALAAWSFTQPDFLLASAALIATVPVSVLWYMACVIVVKNLFIGRITAGTVSVYSPAYLRIWFNRYLMANTRHILLPLYATVYLPWFYRQLGARIGKNTEISTLNEATPDLLEIGDGSFLADECVIGAIRVANGSAELKPVRIGDRCFVGNSALLKGGVTMADGSLLALLSSEGDRASLARENGQWLGSPAFQLPRNVPDMGYSEAELYTPTPQLVLKRKFADAIRALLPAYVWLAGLMAFVAVASAAWINLPLWGCLLVLPAASLATSAFEIAAVAGIKWFISGRFTQTTHPLWSDAVILDEIVNGAYESLSASALPMLQGTPFLAPALRLFGCRIGKWCFLDTTYFSEFDLVEIGDHAALNQGTTVQTHLFEDRVMKSGSVRIGAGCTTGNMSIVLYDTQLQDGAVISPMAVVMKGEILSPGTRASGIPCQNMAAARRIREETPTALPATLETEGRNWRQAAE